VFDRQWLRQKKAEEMECRDKLAAVINDPETSKLAADFTEVIFKCQCMIEKIVDDMSKPFILRAAERVCQELRSESASGSASEKNDVPPAVVAKEKLSDSDEQSIDGNSSTMSVTTGSASALQRSAGQFSGHTSTKMSSVDDIWHPSTEWKRGAGKVGAKIPWSTVEEELVYKGVIAHGVGNWALIRANFLPNRSNVDIKDKWRTMKRQGRLQTLADKLGPLLPSCLY